jgi:hypothetical protein
MVQIWRKVGSGTGTKTKLFKVGTGTITFQK